MEYKGLELKPCDAIVQVNRDGRWLDFATIKDADDCHQAELIIDGRHHQFAGNYRVVTNWHCRRYDISDGKWLEIER